MKLFDLSQVKKVSGDKESTLFRHKDGHEIKVYHKALSNIQREQIKRIASQEMPKSYDEGGKVTDNDDDSESDPSPQSSGHTININVGTQGAGQTPNVPVTPEIKQAPAPVATSNPDQVATLPAQSTNLQTTANENQKNIDIAQAEGTANIAQQQQENADTVANRQNQTVADMKQHTDDFARWIQGNQINPRAYQESMESGQKTATALGLFLGGLGGGGNPALDFLNKQIDRDIQAQKDRGEQAKTVFNAYQTLYGDENVSTALTKVSMNDKILADASLLKAKLGTPQAEQNFQALNAKLLKDNYDQLQKASFLSNQPANTGAPKQEAPGIENPGGAPSKTTDKYGPEHADKEFGSYDIEPILKPNADKLMDQYARRATADPAAQANLPKLQDQYAKAKKADEVLSQAKSIFAQLKGNATRGGWLGRTLGDLPLGAGGEGMLGTGIAVAGKHVGELTTGLRQATGIAGEGNDEQSMDRQYNTSAQKLSDLFSSVYPGIGTENLKNKLSGMIPDKEDTPEDVTKKQKAFEDLIKSSLEKSTLESTGMTRH